MHHEAASTLYSNNIFGFLQEHHGDDLPETSTIFEPCNSIAFLNTIGLNSVLVSNIILDMTFRTCNGPPNLSEEQKSSSLIEVTEYLRPIWQSNLTENLQVTFENHDGFIQDLDAFNKTFRFLQLGSTKVKKYHQLVDRAYIKGDGSGGTISWGPLPTGEDQYVFLPAAYCDTIEFLTTDSGLRLLPQLPAQAPQLMSLPAHIQYKIYDMVLQQVKINADTTASPLSPLLYVNQELQLSRQQDISGHQHVL